MGSLDGLVDGAGCWLAGADDGGHQRAKKLSRGPCGVGGSDEDLARTEGIARRFANYYHHVGIQWHLDYLDACIERGEEVKQRFLEKQCRQGRKSRVVSPAVFSSVFKVHQPNSEVLDQLVFRKNRVFRSGIMDSYPSKLGHDKSEKLQHLIENLYQLKLDSAELDNDEDALPKIILTDCSSNNPAHPRSDASKSAQNNNNSIDDAGHNRLNNNLKLANSLGVPASSHYQSEARPP